MSKESLGAGYFEDVYAANADPWSFETSEYERAKYDRTIAALGGERFRSAFEIGCSIGVLTARLAAHCDALLAVDVEERALAKARARCAALPGVRFERVSAPREWPGGAFDLVVVSEVAYYWSDADLALARDRIAESAPGGTLELVHFLPKVDDYVRDGDAVHEAFLADARFTRLRGERHGRYRLDVLRVAAPAGSG